MAIMLVKMTASTVLYFIITVVLWHFWSRREHTPMMKIIIGISYGLCSVASTHLGVDYKEMVMNVRDMGPLAAGLFFDPVSGIISGVIGGAERYFAGEFMGIGEFTKEACSLSTVLAGFLSAGLNVYQYKGKRPPAAQALFIGAVMEVFHMYAILLTNRGDMHRAYTIVKECSVPMIVFSALGLMGCSLFIWIRSGEYRGYVPVSDPEKTPIAKRFYRRLLAVTLIVFAFNHFLDYNFQTRTALQETEEDLNNIGMDFRRLYRNTNGDLVEAKLYIPYITMTKEDSVVYLVFDSKGKVLSSLYSDETEMSELDEEEFNELKSQRKGKITRRSLKYYGDMDIACITLRLDEQKNLLLGWRYEDIMKGRIDKAYEILLSDVLVFTVLYLLIVGLVDTLVCRNLKKVTGSLQKISSGDLDEVVTVRDSAEFSLLSDDINQTVSTLKGYIDESEKRMEEELKLAAFIQESALPHVFTFTRNDFEVYALMDPARQVGGDFYDFFFTDINKMALVIADVSGKGIPAAMFMMRAKTAIVNAARRGKSPAETLYEVNNILCEGNEAEMFVTAWIGIIDLTNGLMQCANAGHEYPVICRAGGDYELVKDKHALVLAAMENAPMKEYTMQLSPGDRLFVYTDGVPEAINSDEEAYGTGRLVDKLNKLKEEPQERTLKAVHRNIEEFVGEAEQFDDITMLGFTYIGS